MSDNSRKSSSDNEFESSYDAETVEEYKVNGYHPVSLGDNFNSQYKIIRKLGWGHFSTVLYK